MSNTVVIPDQAEAKSPTSYSAADDTFIYSLLIPLLDRRRGCLLAEPDPDETNDVPIPWVVRRHNEPEELVGMSPKFGHFRAALARVGSLFLEGELYGGFTAAKVEYRKELFFYSAYMSNNNHEMSGFWLRLYVKPLSGA